MNQNFREITSERDIYSKLNPSINTNFLWESLKKKLKLIICLKSFMISNINKLSFGIFYFKLEVNVTMTHVLLSDLLRVRITYKPELIYQVTCAGKDYNPQILCK